MTKTEFVRTMAHALGAKARKLEEVCASGDVYDYQLQKRLLEIQMLLSDAVRISDTSDVFSDD